MPRALRLGGRARRGDGGLIVAPRGAEAPPGDRHLHAAAQDAGGLLPPALLQVESHPRAGGGRLDSSGADQEVVGHRVLIAAELQRLLEADQLAGLDVTWLPADQPTPSGDYVAIVPLLSRWVGGTELKRLPKLKIVANCAVGHDNVDVVAAEIRGVKVTNTPDVLTDATADLAWALILACARQVVAGCELVKSGTWTGWDPELLLGIELRGRTLGLFGAGRIGQAVGRRAVPFGMRILYTARNPRPEFERATGAVRAELSRLLRESDVLSLHVPSVPETKGIINADTLRQMKPSAILINTARGDLVREEALAQALEQGRLGGAGLDVYTDEPTVHPRLRAAPRTVLLPHIGSATAEARRQMAAIAVANVQAVLRGDPPLTAVFG
ncbi:MAG: D-glycerate dehydrogenase [Gemmatimonadetes bacterium]|nr:MAG: D-glycerate dehydrogenase [Gemmatimonadota bacterium]